MKGSTHNFSIPALIFCPLMRYISRMFIRDLNECTEITAGDNTALRELFNPCIDPLDLRYSLAHAVVKPGEVTFLHRLRHSEVFYIIEGVAEMRIDHECREVGPGQAIYIPPGAAQNIKNTGDRDLVFLAIVDPAWRPDDEDVMDARAMCKP